VLGDKYPLRECSSTALCSGLKGRSFPSVESFFLDDVSIVENDLIQSAAGLVSQVVCSPVFPLWRMNLIQSGCRPSISGLVSLVLFTSVSIVENDLIQSAGRPSVAIMENDLIQAACIRFCPPVFAIMENDLIQSAARPSISGSVHQCCHHGELPDPAACIRFCPPVLHDDSTLRASNQPEVHVAGVSTKRRRLTITISMVSTKSCNASVHEVDACATSLEQSAEKMSTSTTDGHISQRVRTFVRALQRYLVTSTTTRMSSTALCSGLKGRSFPSVESFFLDEWEPLTLQQTPQVLSTSVSIVKNDLIQSAAGLVSQVLFTSVSIVENDLIQSAAGLVSQVLSTSVSIVENDLIQSAAGLVSLVLSTSVAIMENYLIQSAAGCVYQVLSTSVA
ncbi:unnamed protein product, partial [Coregonus sp. 'balchen']